ncbi:MAG: hypothetical protein FWD72_02610, partial [Eggerthellaceae bacterium]|nr:hypothetical protein [Eggerthellaceae bacterium]
MRKARKPLAVLLAVVMAFVLANFTPLTANAAEPENYFYVYSLDSLGIPSPTQWLAMSKTYADPQDAINAAALWSSDHSDQQAYVLVGVGVYRLDTDFGHSLQLKSHVTVIGGFDGTEADSTPNNTQDADETNSDTNTCFRGNTDIPVFVNTNADSSAVLENAAIEYGNDSAVGGGAGGMTNYSSSPTVTNCFFSNNHGVNGGGMFNDADSSPTITGCTFADNISAGLGGGIENQGTGTLSLSGCTFTSNSAAGSGGGIESSAGKLVLSGCTFSDNSAAAGGGGVNVHSDGATLVNCTFADNTAGSYGGGVNVESPYSATLIGCVATGNQADIGGGINVYGGTLVNCTVVGNTASSQGSGICASYSTVTPTTLINCISVLNNNSNTLANNLYDNTPASVVESSVIGNTAYGTTGTTSPSPAITDFNTDFSLASNAVYAIKTGDAGLYAAAVDPLLAALNGAGGLPLDSSGMVDINGLPVIDTLGKIDLGAFRYPGTVTSVTVSPATAMVRKGLTVSFSATVVASNGAGTRVVWSVMGGVPGTSIDANGVLTAAVGETATTLTVTATSAEDATKFDSATVTVLDIPPATTGVTANAGYGGTVGNGGSGLAYTVAPNVTGCVIDQVFVDGVEQTVPDRSAYTYTFPDDGGPHCIFATFAYTAN